LRYSSDRDDDNKADANDKESYGKVVRKDHNETVIGDLYDVDDDHERNDDDIEGAEEHGDDSRNDNDCKAGDDIRDTDGDEDANCDCEDKEYVVAGDSYKNNYVNINVNANDDDDDGGYMPKFLVSSKTIMATLEIV